VSVPSWVEWARNGERLFFHSTGRETVEQLTHTSVGEYIVATGAVHQVTLPFVGATGNGVAVDREDVLPLLKAKTTLRPQCQAPNVQPSGRTQACRIRVT
jgi:hypothetical protein